MGFPKTFASTSRDLRDKITEQHRQREKGLKQEQEKPMPREKLFEPGTYVLTFTGQAGIILSDEELRKARQKIREGKRPGHYFAPGCCQNPDYVLQVPVLFEDSTFDIMRAMNIKKGVDLSEDKRARLHSLLEALGG